MRPAGQWSVRASAAVPPLLLLPHETGVPALGVATAMGLILYYLGAVITCLRARSYKTVPFPLLYLAPVAVTLGLGLAA
ncbi:DoxX family protein [Kitasatospora purpeofusca]|uniref:DoxX family protein n=1 Tax=Kitasatospora purpeofusca TaxID=67352 RepID=UPI0035DEAB09